MRPLPDHLPTSWQYALRCADVRRAWGALALAALLTGLWVLLGWAPIWREHARLSERVATARSAQAQALRLREAEAARRQVLPAMAALEQKLRTPASQADLIQGIARLAARRGVRVTAQAFDEGRAASGSEQALRPLYLELGLQGEYGALRRLQGDLASLPMWIELVEERMELAAAGAVKAQWRLLTYRGGGGGS